MYIRTFFYVFFSIAALASVTISLVYSIKNWKNQRLRKNLFWLTVGLLAAVGLTELAMVCYGVEDFSWQTLLVGTFQAFTLDSGYEALTSAPVVFHKALATAVSVLRALIYTAAPLAGGAVVLDILADAFPSLRMYFYRRKPMLVFSELNQKSILLAESLDRRETEEGRERPIIVFTDCYVNAHEEEESELLQRTRRLRCVCLEEDILHSTSFTKSESCSFFLIDDKADGDFDDESNLTALCGLLQSEPKSWKREKGCRIFIFSNNSEGMENIRCVKKGYDEQREEEKKQKAEKNQVDDTGPVSVHLVRDYALASCIHLKETPLFANLNEKKGTPLKVAIFGANQFAREMFKTVFWTGQILDHPLELTVVYQPEEPPEAGDSQSSEKLTEFERWLERLSPEIRQCCTEDSECLRMNLGGEGKQVRYSSPYAALRFIETDIRTADLRKLLGEELKGCGRFIVMQDGDSANIALADELRRNLVYIRKKSGSDSQTVVSYVVENDSLLEVAGRRFETDSRDSSEKGDGFAAPKMVPFGSLKERFDWENVYTDGEYLAARNRDALCREHEIRDISSTRDDIYNDWSRVARAFHQQYAMYSVGCWDEDPLVRAEKYIRFLHDPAHKREVVRLRWLEHRRWCAFLRVEGFCCPPDMLWYLKHYQKLKDQDDWHSFWRYGVKDVVSRLHPCLVECEGENGEDSGEADLLDLVARIRDLTRKGSSTKKSVEGPAWRKKPVERPAWRKNLAAWYDKRDKGEIDIKIYDLPDRDYSPRLGREDTLAYLTDNKEAAASHEDFMNRWNKLWKDYPDLSWCQADQSGTQFYMDRLMAYKNPERYRS